MKKSEFITAINKLSAPYTYGWEKRDGFNECKNKIMELANDLDEQGLTVEAFKRYKETLNEMNERYNDLFTLQRQVFDANNSKIFVQKENERLFKENEEFLHEKIVAEEFIQKHGLWEKFIKETKQNETKSEDADR